MPSLSVPMHDVPLIELIVQRAMTRAGADLQDGQAQIDPKELTLDLVMCHANGNPIDLERLLSSDNQTFDHDVWGITCELNRYTGQLKYPFKLICARKL